MITTYLFCLILTLISILVYLTWKRLNYWKLKKVPHLKPALLFGNYKDYLYLKRNVCDIEQALCQQFPKQPYIGVYYGTEPALIVQDPELIGLIMSKDFNYFNGRQISRFCHKEIITNSIFFLFGERWKVSQQACTPLFTTSRLKNMFHMIEKCSSDLEKLLDQETSISTVIEVKEIMAQYTMDCICSCILGVNANTLDKSVENNPFRVMGSKIFEWSPKRQFLYIVRTMWPSIFYGLGFKAFPEDINSFFLHLYRDVCKTRDEKPSSRNDIIDYFLANKQKDDLVIGILVSLFGAGYETSAITLSHLLYELARNQEAQSLAMKEVDEYLKRTGGKVTYECVNDLKYLVACTNETMRLYPVLGVITREVMQNYTLPTGLRLEKGIRIHLPIYHIHRDPNNFPEPDKFKPERFLGFTPKPYTFMPFGEGRRTCVVYLTWKRLNYWKLKKVPHLKPALLFGNYKDYLYLKRKVCHIEQALCQQFPGEPYIGAYYGTEPALIVQDPELIGLIMSKDFNYFNGRQISRYCHKEIITNSIFFLFGERWKVSQQACTPLFTTSRLKNMFHMIEKCSSDLEKLLDQETSISRTIEVKEIMAQYTMDCICSCILGVNANTLDKSVENNSFRVMGSKIFEWSPKKQFLYIVRTMWPSVFYALGYKAFSEDINSFFLHLYRDVCKTRDDKPSSRNDIIDYFLANKQKDDFVIGILVSLFGAGYETSAITLSHLLYELARNQEAQDLAMKEVDEYLKRTGGKVTYECVNDLKYLVACTNETMRLYPVLGVITREVMQNYTLPTGLRLEKGIRIHLPIYHIHRDPNNFPEPDKFKPERFLGFTPKPYTFMPFGEGRRTCVGKRFSTMQMIPGLVTILKKYRLSVADSMPPLEHEIGNIVTTPKGPILINFTRREEKSS